MNDAINALMARARTGLLVAADLDETDAFNFWQGYIDALRSMTDKAASLTHLVARDQASGGYQPPTYLVAAFTALPEDVKALTLGDVQQLLRAQGIEPTCDLVSNANVDGVEELEHSKSAIVDLHQEQAGAAVEHGHGALAHGLMVVQGGAA